MEEKTMALKTRTPDGKVVPIYAKVTDSTVAPSISYLETLNEFNQTLYQGNLSETVMKEAIIVSNKLFLLGGVCGTVVDAKVTMANTIMEIDTGDDELNAVVEHLRYMINYDNPRTMMGVRQLNEEMFLDINLNGNCFPYETWKTIKYKGKDWFLPTSVMPLNPLNIEIRQNDAHTNEIIRYYNNRFYDSGTGNTSKNAPSVLEVPKSNMKRVTRRGRQYSFWGIPFLTRAFPALAIKERLKKLDESVTQGLIQLITIFSLYDEKTGAVADEETVELFADSLAGQPSKARYLTWGGNLKIHTAGPNGEILKFTEKYAETDKDIMQALGAPTLLLDVESKGNTAGADYAVKPFINGIRDDQNIVGDWWVYLVRKIATLNGKEVDNIRYRWSAVDLENEATVISKIKNARDSGLLSSTSAALKLGASSRLETDLINKERKMQKDDPDYQFGLPAATPFQGANGLNPSGTTMPGGDGRPKKEEPKNAVDPVKQVTLKEDRKQGKTNAQLHESINELSTWLIEALYANLSKDIEQIEKLELPLLTAVQIAHAFQREVAEDMPDPKAFFKTTLAECNQFSLDVQQDILKGEVDKTKCQRYVTDLVDKIFKSYEEGRK